MILPFRVTIGPVENHDTTGHIMTDPPPCLTTGKRQSRSCACSGTCPEKRVLLVLQTCTPAVVRKTVQDDSSDYITFFQLSIEQVL
ncbi:hypothetical protein TNCV_657991 [Trichonephila clavipes]|uniref:Uncharacterized protein n=1 Tax=Trichonephila clavipes TaxID=2585209 RepID=A0A8X6SSD8_TRICX|nr:hypothetical protein TNCV_657991 [Trichonephila clavipes]